MLTPCLFFIINIVAQGELCLELMEESTGKQCTVVFVLIVTEPASAGGGGPGRGSCYTPRTRLADSVTIYAKTTDELFPRFLLHGLKERKKKRKKDSLFYHQQRINIFTRLSYAL